VGGATARGLSPIATSSMGAAMKLGISAATSAAIGATGEIASQIAGDEPGWNGEKIGVAAVSNVIGSGIGAAVEKALGNALGSVVPNATGGVDNVVASKTLTTAVTESVGASISAPAQVIAGDQLEHNKPPEK
jgi:hypothetical protein